MFPFLANLFLIPEHGMLLFFTLSNLFLLYSRSLRVLVVYLHPSDSEEFLYQDRGHSDIAHDISAEASVS